MEVAKYEGERRKAMKRLWGTLTAVTVILPFLAFGQGASYNDRSYVRMSYVQGDVFVQRAQDQGYEQGQLNLVVVQGDKLGTKAGRLEIQLGRGNYLRLDNDTQVDLAGLPNRDGDPTKLHVLAGSVYIRVRGLDREKAFEVHSPDASFYILEEGLYRIDVRENRETEFIVVEGSAEAAGQEGSVGVREREQVIAANGQFVSEPLPLQARRDGFDSWNATREGLYARAVSQRYLPAEYSDYENELAEYGNWAYEEPYGNVWVPRVSYSSWRPYEYGRWVWYPIIGWTWVSYDSWGWCTSHFGRWGWRLGLGWYWIPQNHWGWGPAWVDWFWDNNYYGWCPLSYWDYPAVILNNIFFGRRHNYHGWGDYSRTMVMVDRRHFEHNRLRDVALGADRIAGRGGQVDFRGGQPDLRGNPHVRDDIASRGARVVSRDSIRSVERSFDAGRRMSIDNRSTPVVRRDGSGSDAGARVVRERTASGMENDAGRTVQPKRLPLENGKQDISSRPSNGSSAAPRRDAAGSGSSVIRSRSDSPASNNGSGQMDRRIREYSRGGGEGSVRTQPGSGTKPSDGSSSTVRRSDDRASSPGARSSGVWEYSIPRSGGSASPKVSEAPARSRANEGASAPRSGDSSRTIRSFPSRDSSSSRIASPPSRSSDSSRSSSPPSSGGNLDSRRITSTPSRSSSSPSRSYESRSSSSSSSRSTMYPSRSSSTPSRSSISPSRSYESSRSYSAPSRSYSSPSRSSSSSSRSYSSPSRSSSSPSRSYSSPSRSSSSSSRSYSSPSRSSSSSSRSSSSSSSRSSSGRSSSGSRRR